MSRYKRDELEKAVDEKIAQGYVCIGDGIVEVGKENKMWSYEGNRSKYCGRSVQQKFIVKMKAPERKKQPA